MILLNYRVPRRFSKKITKFYVFSQKIHGIFKLRFKYYVWCVFHKLIIDWNLWRIRHSIQQLYTSSRVKVNKEIWCGCSVCNPIKDIRDGVLSAFQQQYASCYNLPFTGLTLVSLVQTYNTSVSEYMYYQNLEHKCVNLNFERV